MFYFCTKRSVFFFFIFVLVRWASFAQVLSTSFNSSLESWVVLPSTDATSWRRNTTEGVSNGGCLKSTAVCEEGASANSCVNTTNYFAASPGITLTAGYTYQVALKCSVATASTRKAVVGYHTSQQRSGATTIHDFGTITSTSGYQSYSYNFTVPSTGTYYMVFWGEQVSMHTAAMWMDDFSVTVINTPPTTTLTGPTNGGTYTPGQGFNMTATVTDAESNVSKVEFYVNGSKVGEDATSPYSKSYTPLSGGSLVLTAKAIDSYGANHTSSSRTVTMKSVPVVALTQPATESTQPEGPLTLSATATDADGSIASVAFYVNSALVHTDYTSPYSYTYTATVGSYSFNVIATDNEGYTQSEFGEFMDDNYFEVVANACSLLKPTTTKQTLCSGDSLKLKSIKGTAFATTIQWQRKPTGGSFTNITGATDTTYWAKLEGIYRAIWTFTNSATCTTGVDTVEIITLPNAQFNFDTSACALVLDSIQTNSGSVSYTWTHSGSAAHNLPSSNAGAVEGYIRYNTPGSHSVILTVTSGSTGCSKSITKSYSTGMLNGVVSNNTISEGMNTIFTAYAFPVNGMGPYDYNWTNDSLCLTPDCDTIRIKSILAFTIVEITDSLGCAFTDTAEGGIFGKKLIIPTAPLSACEGSNMLCNGGFEISTVGSPGYGSGEGISSAQFWSGAGGNYYHVAGNSDFNIPDDVGTESGGNLNNPNPVTGVTNQAFIGLEGRISGLNQSSNSSLSTGKKYILSYNLRSASMSDVNLIPMKMPFAITGLSSNGNINGVYSTELPIAGDMIDGSWGKFNHVIQPNMNADKFVFSKGNYLNYDFPFPGPGNPNASWYALNSTWAVWPNSFLYIDNIYFAEFPEFTCPNLFLNGSAGQITCKQGSDWVSDFVANNPDVSFHWEPETNLSNPDILNPTANPSVATAYECTMTLNGEDYSLGTVWVYPNYTIDLGENPEGGCCPEPIVIDAACTGDFNSNAGQDIKILLNMYRIGSNPFRKLIISSTTSDIDNTFNVDYFYGSWLSAGSPSSSGHGQSLILQPSDILGFIGGVGSTVPIRITVEADQMADPGEKFRIKVYTETASPPANCCRKAVSEGGEDYFSEWIKPQPKAVSPTPKWRIFPNPASQDLTIQARGNGNAFLYNSFGKRIMEITLNDQETKIPVSQIPAGLYRLQIDLDGKREFQTFTVIH